MGVFQDYYQKTAFPSTSPSEIAWISSTELFIVFACGPVFGGIINSHGPRPVLAFGSALQLLGLSMMSIAKKYYQVLLAQGIGSSIGTSAIYYAGKKSCFVVIVLKFIGVTCVSSWFEKNRALALGVMSSGSSLGGIIYPTMISGLITRIEFGWTVRSIIFLMFIMLIVANMTVASHSRPIRSPVRLAQFIAPFREQPFGLVCLGSFLFCSAMFLPFNFISGQAEAYGISAADAGYLVVVLNTARNVYRKKASHIYANRL
jgi:MFS family permease